MTYQPITANDLTGTMVRKLRNEAAQHDDRDLCLACSAWIAGSDKGEVLDAIVDAINDARAMAAE